MNIGQAPARGSESEETVDLHHERAILEGGEALAARVVLVGVDDEKLAARRVFPAESQVAAEAVVDRTVLQECAGEHPRREGVIGPHTDQSGREVSGG